MIKIMAAFAAACVIFVATARAGEEDIERFYIADFETHPTALGGKIGVYGAAAPWSWQYPGSNFSWFYDPSIMPYDISNVHSGVRSFRLVNMRSSPDWASMGINLGPIIDALPASSMITTGSIDVSNYEYFEFWVKGAGVNSIAVLFRDAHCRDYAPQLEITVSAPSGEWGLVQIPISSIAGKVDIASLAHIGFDVGSIRGNSVGSAIFIDDVAFSKTK